MGGSTLKIELGGDLILFHADPTNFLPLWSRMVGATADMRRLADEAIAKIYNLSELRHSFRRIMCRPNLASICD